MDRLGPFEPHPRLAAAVSGGADSMALAVLVRDWARAREGNLLALIVDHGLRAESGEEAQVTRLRLSALGIASRILPLSGLARGPALAERARAARYDVLTRACREASIRHLLLGHHAGDQVETVAMRVLRGSRNDGLAGMSCLRETAGVRLLRPLLALHPARLRTYLTERGIGWVEDPSNCDLTALRPRLRQGLAGGSWDRLLAAISLAGARRADDDAATASVLARQAVIHPEGYAHVTADRLPPGALSALLTAIGGAAYPPDPDVTAGLAARLSPATLHGVRVMSAGRLGNGWLIVREEASMEPIIPAATASMWDRRFTFPRVERLPEGATIGGLGDDAARFRRMSPLPSAVLRTLPAIRVGKIVTAIPHLGYADANIIPVVTVIFAPARPVDAPAFVPACGDWMHGQGNPAE